MDISSLKYFEGKTVSIILNNGNVYSNIVYKCTNKGTVEFIDNKGGDECYVSSDYVKLVREVKWE